MRPCRGSACASLFIFLFIYYPEGLGGIDENGEKYVALLKSAVFGHPDTAGCWNETMNGWIKYFFSRNGWTIRMLHNDPRVSVILSPEDAPSILIMSIDVCYLQGEREEDLEYIRRSFGDAFGIKRGTDSVENGESISRVRGQRP